MVPHCDEQPGAVEINTLHMSDERADIVEQFDGRHVVAGTLMYGIVDISTLVDGKVFPKWCHKVEVAGPVVGKSHIIKLSKHLIKCE